MAWGKSAAMMKEGSIGGKKVVPYDVDKGKKGPFGKNAKLKGPGKGSLSAMLTGKK